MMSTDWKSISDAHADGAPVDLWIGSGKWGRRIPDARYNDGWRNDEGDLAEETGLDATYYREVPELPVGC